MGLACDKAAQISPIELSLQTYSGFGDRNLFRYEMWVSSPGFKLYNDKFCHSRLSFVSFRAPLQ